jgi:hypothetical protein
MRIFALIGLVAASTCWAQEPATITISAGTRIPLVLASPITNKSARPGNAIRAVTGFPVTVGTQLAIPAGTYVEGVIDKKTKGRRPGPSLRIHLTRMLFPNGYSVAVDGINTQANAVRSGFPGPSALGLQQSQGLPPLPNSGTHIGAMAGAAGAAVAGIVAIVLLSHHQGGGVLFDTGWQFEMVLQSPLTLDAASVAAAIVIPSAR